MKANKRGVLKGNCFINEDNQLIHAWNCSCDKNYWESDAGKKDKNYNQYLKLKDIKIKDRIALLKKEKK